MPRSSRAGSDGSGLALVPNHPNKVALKLLGKRAGATAFDDMPAPAAFLMLRPLVQRSLTWWWRRKDALRGG